MLLLRSNFLPYPSKGKQAADDGFEWWNERFKERAKVAGWTAEHQLYQLKVHLDQTASNVFQMIPETESETLSTKLLLHWGSV